MYLFAFSSELHPSPISSYTDAYSWNELIKINIWGKENQGSSRSSTFRATALEEIRKITEKVWSSATFLAKDLRERRKEETGKQQPSFPNL